MTALPKRAYTLEEFIELDKNSEEKYEYFDGEVFAVGELHAVTGSSLNYSLIAGNIIRYLENRLKGRPFEILTPDVQVKVPALFPYCCPDATVVCGKPVIEEIQGQQMLVNPILIVEVLSPMTAAYDHGDKFLAYQSVESFREYLLIAQERPHVTQYVRQANGKWLRSDLEGLDSAVMLESLDVTLALQEIYSQVSFQTPEAEFPTPS